MLNTSQSAALFERGSASIPGAVNSPVRAFSSVGGTPRFIKKAAGAYMTDVDGNRYIDYIGSWGPMIAGHAHPKVMAAVTEAMQGGLSFGAPTESEILMAEELCKLVPSMDLVRMTSSGTEATMSAIRLARGHTGRDKILKFEGCYHGHGDSLLVKAGSGALTLGVPSSPGIPASLAKHTLTATFNDLQSVEDIFHDAGEDIACIIVEPVAGNMNCIPPAPGFLEGLRAICDRYETILIFDEVMTGFRVALGGAQELYGVQADLTTLGKIIGGGMPVGAFGGRREIMQSISPLGPVYQAGTLSGNPVAMAAGLATLQIVQEPGFYATLAEKTRRLMAGFEQKAEAAGLPMSTVTVGGMFGFFLNAETAPNCFSDVTSGDVEGFKKLFHAMLERGVYLAPSAYEAGFMSQAHGDHEIEATLQAAEQAFALIGQ